MWKFAAVVQTLQRRRKIHEVLNTQDLIFSCAVLRLDLKYYSIR